MKKVLVVFLTFFTFSLAESVSDIDGNDWIYYFQETKVGIIIGMLLNYAYMYKNLKPLIGYDACKYLEETNNYTVIKTNLKNIVKEIRGRKDRNNKVCKRILELPYSVSLFPFRELLIEENTYEASSLLMSMAKINILPKKELKKLSTFALCRSYIALVCLKNRRNR